VFALAAAFAQTFPQLLAGRLAWGMAAAGVVPLAMAWIGDTVALEERQAMLARLLLGTLSGMTLGQLAGGLFADSGIGWRGAFVSIAVAYIVVVVLMLQRFRAMGWGTGVAAPSAAPHRQAMEVLRVRWSWIVLGGAFVEGMFLFGPVAFMPTVVHQRWDWTLTASAALLSLFALGGVIYAIAAPAIVRRLGQVRMAASGGWLMGLGFLAWLLTPLPWIVGPIALIVGFGTYLFHNTLQTHATQMVPAARATAMSMFAFVLFLSQAIGAALAGLAFDHLGAAWMLLPSAIVLPLAGIGFARALRRHVAA
jgi:predicted MFS family arabinose efflux permease